MLVIGSVPAKLPIIERPEFAYRSTPDVIQRRGYIRIGVSFDLPGFAWFRDGSDFLEGFEIELAYELASLVFGVTRESVRSYIELVPMISARRASSLIDKDVDLVVSNYADTEDRRQLVDFAGHYLSSKHAPVLGPHSPSITSLEDLRGLNIAVVSGTTDEVSLRALAPSADIRVFDSISQCLMQLDCEKVEAVWSTTAANAGHVRNSRKEADLRAGGEKVGGWHCKR